MKLVYLAHAIDQASEEQQRHANILAGGLIALPDVGVYRPVNAWVVGQSAPDPRLEVVNRAALDNCDALIAVIERGVPTVGTAREIEAFAAAGKPWAVVTNLHESFSLADAPRSFTLDLTGVKGVVEWVRALSPSSETIRGATPLRFAKDGQYDGCLPTRAHSTDAGFDLYVAQRTVIPSGQFRDVPCGVRVALPPDVWARVVGRSSTLRNRRLLVAEGVLDSGYRGPLFAGAWNQGDTTAVVDVGERIAQLIPMPNITPNLYPAWASAVEFAAIPHDGRGDAGFGSSGS